MKVCGKRYCSAINCNNNKKRDTELCFFRFPKDPNRSKVWVVNCRRKDIKDKDAMSLYNNYQLCSENFEMNQFYNSLRKKLLPTAIPTIFDVPNKPPTLMIKRKVPNKFPLPIKQTNECTLTTFKQTLTCNPIASSSKIDTVVKESQEILELVKRLKTENNRLKKMNRLWRDKVRRLKQSHTMIKKAKKQRSSSLHYDITTINELASKYLSSQQMDFLLS